MSLLNSHWVQSELKLNIECICEFTLVNSILWMWVEFSGITHEFVVGLIEWHIPWLSLHGELGGQLKFASLHSGTQDNSWVPQDECTNKSYPQIELSLSADLGLSMWVGCKSAVKPILNTNVKRKFMFSV